jgi:hypothetical protein
MKQVGIIAVRIPLNDALLVGAFDGIVKNLPTQTGSGLTLIPQGFAKETEKIYTLPINSVECLGPMVRFDIEVEGSGASLYVPVDMVVFAIVGSDLGKLGFAKADLI